MTRQRWEHMAMMACVVALTGCASARDPLPLAQHVDLDAFMGAWYVVGYTPIVVDKNAHNAVEHYARDEKGRVLTTYQFRKGGFDGPIKTHTPTGFVPDPDQPAVWDMQFVWPFKADYRIAYLSEDGARTIIAHPNRTYAWIMTRTPDVEAVDYAAMLSFLDKAGFDTNTVLRVPHDWRDEAERLRAIERAGSARPLAPR